MNTGKKSKSILFPKWKIAKKAKGKKGNVLKLSKFEMIPDYWQKVLRDEFASTTKWNEWLDEMRDIFDLIEAQRKKNSRKLEKKLKKGRRDEMEEKIWYWMWKNVKTRKTINEYGTKIWET